MHTVYMYMYIIVDPTFSEFYSMCTITKEQAIIKAIFRIKNQLSLVHKGIYTVKFIMHAIHVLPTYLKFVSADYI